MRYTITKNIMYIRNEVGELVPVSMITSGSVKSSTPDSTKQFKIIVDGSGTLTATEVT